MGKLSTSKFANFDAIFTLKNWLGELNDLRTIKWVDLVTYPELTYKNVLELTR